MQSAHAKLVRTLPVSGATLQRQPASVIFYFSEPVEANFAVIRVFDPRGVAVENGAPFRPARETAALGVALQPNLPDGTYSATYRLISADSDVVSGGFVFSIGKPSSEVAPIPDRGLGPRAPRSRCGPIAGSATGRSGSASAPCSSCSGPGAPHARSGGAGNEERWVQASAAFDRRLRLLVGLAVVVGVLTSLLALPLQGASAAGTSLSGGFDREVLEEVAGTRFGSLMLVRAAAWAVLGAILVVAARRRRGGPLDRPISPELFALVMLPIGSLLISPALAGHAGTQGPEVLLVPADVVHVTAMSLWLGGLATLAVAVPAAARRLEQPEHGRLLVGVLSRFSGVALVSVAALMVSGLVQAVVEVGSVPALVETGYGRAVIAKVLLLGVLIGLGAANRRRLIPALLRAAAAASSVERIWRSMQRNVRVEVALIAVVLGVTAVLVAFAPPSDTGAAAPPPQRVSGRTTIGDVILRYTIDPARVGMNQLNFFLLQADGRPYTGASNVRAELSLPDKGVEPRVVRLQRVGPGHFVFSAAELDAAGRWSLKVMTEGTSRRASDQAELQVAIG